ncbi:MAG: hypothetical protein AABY95_04755 [Pseudomonadota bacterium]
MTAVLITGASGFYWCPTVRVLAAMDPARRLLRAGRTATAYAPLDLACADIAVPRGIHTVLHLAGEKRDESRMWTVNHQGAEKLAEAAASARAQKRFDATAVAARYRSRVSPMYR